MLFRKKKKLSEWAKKFDKLVTGLIVWGAVASMIGLSKTNKGKQVTENIKKEWQSVARSWLSFLGKVLVGTLQTFESKDKNNKK